MLTSSSKMCIDGSISAIHDVSDGGVIICVLEMAFAGYCSVEINVDGFSGEDGDPVCSLFAEEVGWVIEAEEEKAADITNIFVNKGVFVSIVGTSSGFGKDATVSFIPVVTSMKIHYNSLLLGVLSN